MNLHGVYAHIPIAELDGDHSVANIFHTHQESSHPVYLVLRKARDVTREGRQLYHLGCYSKPSWHGGEHYRLVQPMAPIPASDWRWMDIYLSHRPTFRAQTVDPPEVMGLFGSGVGTMPYRLKPGMLLSLAGMKLKSATLVPMSWDGNTPIILIFRLFDSLCVVSLTLGTCDHPSERPDGSSSHNADLEDAQHPCLPHYAFVSFHGRYSRPDPDGPLPPHACPDDHVASWTDWSRTFRGERLDKNTITRHPPNVTRRLEVTVSFSLSPLDAVGRTLELIRFDLKVRGAPLYDDRC